MMWSVDTAARHVMAARDQVTAVILADTVRKLLSAGAQLTGTLVVMVRNDKGGAWPSSQADPTLGAAARLGMTGQAERRAWCQPYQVTLQT
ncbi:hypothetical protein ACFXJ5_41125 [Streptomyces sp. NPDC059373]